jgi:hypothetical protein
MASALFAGMAWHGLGLFGMYCAVYHVSYATAACCVVPATEWHYHTVAHIIISHSASLFSSLYSTLLLLGNKFSNFSPHHDGDPNCYHHFYLYLFFTGLKRIGDLYKRHFEEATEEVRRLEVIVAETKESSARQISMLRDSLQTLGTLTSPLLYLPSPALSRPVLP